MRSPKSAPLATAGGAGDVRSWHALLRLMRPRQWTKNLIIFAAPIFAFHLTLATLTATLLAFGAFCAASSAWYVTNDLLDVRADRAHPLKRFRPIASGAVAPAAAIVLATVLTLAAGALALRTSLSLVALLSLYALLQISYNVVFKQQVVLDVIAISGGFIIRAFAGSAVTGVPLSAWFLLCTGFLALFLAVEKRKAELAACGEVRGRRVLALYTPALLTRIETVVTSGTVLTYALWSSGPQLEGAASKWMLLTIPFVLYGVFRYQFLTDRTNTSSALDLGERPEEVLLTDRPLQITLVAWALTIVFILALRHAQVVA